MLSIGGQKIFTYREMAELLRSIGSFYYWPNEGNLGDLLIAEATRQFFEQEKLKWAPYNPANPPLETSYNLVYGGGGRFTSHWGSLEKHLTHLISPRVSRCIILPHSFHQVDSFLQKLDARHTVFCRGSRSFDYVTSCTPQQVQVRKGHDMALNLQLSKLPGKGQTPPGFEQESTRLASLMQHASRTLKRKVWQATVSCHFEGRSRKIAFLLRTDKERNLAVSSKHAYDISLFWSSSCSGNAYTPELIRLFAAALQYPDIIVTDRLHVGILSLLCNKQVYLLDNNYGKLEEVYQQSLQGNYPVSLVCDTALPLELQKAFSQLEHSWKSRFIHLVKKLTRRS